jgi:hypothetical protein
MPTSPYRGPAEHVAPAPSPFPARSRRLGLGLLPCALAGSLLVHATALGAAAMLPGSPASAPGEPLPASPYEDALALVALHPGLDTQWSPPPPLRACFDAGEIAAAEGALAGPFSHARGWAFPYLVTWADVDLDGPHVRRCCDSRWPLVQELFQECERASQATPAAPQARFTVVLRRSGPEAVRVIPPRHADLDDRLVCCLERTGEWLASTLPQDEELRFEGGPDGGGGDILPARMWPMLEPAPSPR